MAKKKKRSRRQGIVSKLANAGLIALTFATPLTLLFGPGTIRSKIGTIIQLGTFGVVGGVGTPGGIAIGAFDLNQGLAMYAPAGAAAGLNELKKYAMRHYPVRG